MVNDEPRLVPRRQGPPSQAPIGTCRRTLLAVEVVRVAVHGNADVVIATAAAEVHGARREVLRCDGDLAADDVGTPDLDAKRLVDVQRVGHTVAVGAVARAGDEVHIIVRRSGAFAGHPGAHAACVVRAGPLVVGRSDRTGHFHREVGVAIGVSAHVGHRLRALHAVVVHVVVLRRDGDHRARVAVATGEGDHEAAAAVTAIGALAVGGTEVDEHGVRVGVEVDDHRIDTAIEHGAYATVTGRIVGLLQRVVEEGFAEAVVDGTGVVAVHRVFVLLAAGCQCEERRCGDGNDLVGLHDGDDCVFRPSDGKWGARFDRPRKGNDKSGRISALGHPFQLQEGERMRVLCIGSMLFAPGFLPLVDRDGRERGIAVDVRMNPGDVEPVHQFFTQGFLVDLAAADDEGFASPSWRGSSKGVLWLRQCKCLVPSAPAKNHIGIMLCGAQLIGPFLLSALVSAHVLGQQPFITRVISPGLVPTTHKTGALSADGKLAQLGGFQAPAWDFTVSVYDSLSNFLWGKRLAPFGPTDALQPMEMKWTSAGDLVVTGQINLASPKVGVLRFDPQGTLLWAYSYDPVQNDAWGYGQSLVALANDHIVLAFSANSAVMLDIDPDGGVAWAHGLLTTSPPGNRPMPMTVSSQNEIILVSDGYQRTAITCFDASGAFIWEKSIPPVLEYGSDIVRSSDGSFLLCGRNLLAPAAMLVNVQGNLVWAKQYNYLTPYWENLIDPLEIADGYRLHVIKSVFGGSNALALDIEPNGNPIVLSGLEDTWLTDAVHYAGSFQGRRYYSAYLYPPSPDGGILEAYSLFRLGTDLSTSCGQSALPVTATDIAFPPLDTVYAFGGFSNEPMVVDSLQFYIIPMVFATEDACSFFSSVNGAEEPTELRAYPSPAAAGTPVMFRLGSNSPVRALECFASDGHRVTKAAVHGGIGDVQLSTLEWPAGLYVVRALNDQGRTIGALRLVLE